MGNWEKEARSVSRLTDSRGMKIDDGIFDTVVALRLLNINTVMSCEGHIDSGYGPYVSFEAKDAAKDRKRLLEVRQSKISEEKEIVSKMSREEIAERYKLFAYLDKFYSKRNCPQTQRLAIENLGFCSAILRPQSAILIGSASGETLAKRKKILQVCKKEMADFTEFLKKEYFSV